MAKAPRRVTLPGILYQKNGRWWWDVTLPGEDKPKARALKPDGSRCATTDLQEAEEIAREMWRHAIEDEAEAGIKARVWAKAERANAKIRAEAADAIEKAQAECEKKIKKSKRAVARAEKKAKAQSEARLRAEEGYRIEAEQVEEQYASEIAKIRKTIEQAKVELKEKDRAYKEALAEAEENARAEAKLRVEAEQRAESEAQARAEVEARLNEVLDSMDRIGTCECCGKKDVPENDLSKIDSGQQLCPDCLRMMRG